MGSKAVLASLRGWLIADSIVSVCMELIEDQLHNLCKSFIFNSSTCNVSL